MTELGLQQRSNLSLVDGCFRRTAVINPMADQCRLSAEKQSVSNRAGITEFAPLRTFNGHKSVAHAERWPSDVRRRGETAELAFDQLS